jgi:methanogenic corrinoid protein MtbC1
MDAVIQRLLPASAHPITSQYIGDALRALPDMPVHPECFLKAENPNGQLARNWMDALLAQDRRRAVSLIWQAIDRGITLPSIYDDVIVACLREAGALWQTRVINEAQEHYCSVTASDILSVISAEFDIPKKKKTAVGFCVANEQHSLGLRLALDCFELLGWDTVCLGGSVPNRNIEWILHKWTPDVVALSVTMIYHLKELQEAISDIRAVSNSRKVLIMVGGHPFNICPGLWKKVGADLEGGSCRHAMELAEKLDVRYLAAA